MGKLYDLDDDVLLIILSLISQRDALRLASTCHFGYNIALPRFLSKVDIQYSMRKSHKVAGFCKFMLADAPRRLPYLREFPLADGCPYFPQPFNHSIDPESVALLVQVLRRATEVKKLTIGNEDDLLMNHPELLDALAALPHLQTIRLEYCGWPSLTLLSRSISCPHTLDIFDCNLGGSEGDDDLPIAQNIVTSVRNMKVQLSHLGIDDDLEEDGLEFVPTRLLTGTVWSSVRALNLSECSDMSDSARAFPNLHNLTYSNTDPRPVDNDPLVKWSNLDSVMARCRVPLASRVRRLVLRYTCPPEAEFLTLLQRCTPTILSFNASLVYASYCEGVQGLMTRAVRSNLRYLELYTFWHERNPDQIVQSEIVPGIVSAIFHDLANSNFRNSNHVLQAAESRGGWLDGLSKEDRGPDTYTSVCGIGPL
ncbi:hypothetical protein BKA93DRAFT_805844 [Sparassis latifolia]